ncbi:ead/Ea22-like family protein [Pseudocitrobacter faecalis]|uniref:ead/Ea22-like family protein n=1 Tax=Pseudocitrobacter faecalis TaxID=1398493 RepID=UPI003315091B
MSMTTELAQRMKAAALKATPGEWVYLPSNTSIEYDYGSDDSQGSITYMDSGDFTQKQTELNGIFIALANPANVLALVEALEARDKQIAELRVSNRILCSDAMTKQDRITWLESYSKTTLEFREAALKENRHLKLEQEIAEKRIAELEASHSKLRETLAGIHNTIRTDGSYTPLAAILNAAKRAHEESAAATGVAVEGE